MDGKSSLDRLVDINQAERQLQLAHFDSLDTKAGLVLGFAGVLIALGNGSGNLPGAVSTILAAVAAVAPSPTTRYQAGTAFRRALTDG